uniref:Uncharacterized protein n=1 Tax=Cucumis melo TaxID=3656 RepID=A0A9I9EBU2_CUCME
MVPCLQKMPKNSFPSNMQSSAPPTTPHAPPSEIHASVLPPQTASTNPSVQPFSSSATNIAPHAPICVLPPKSGRQPPLLPSNLYALPPIDLSHHPNVKNTKIHSTFEIGESLAHSNPNVQVSSGIAQQQLEGLRKQIAALEATLRTTSNTSIPIEKFSLQKIRSQKESWIKQISGDTNYNSLQKATYFLIPWAETYHL